MKFLLWMANHYYRSDIQKELDYAIGAELYEYAGALNNALSAFEMPLIRG